MFPTSLTAIELFGKKRDISLYKAKDTSHHYLLKSIITEDSSIKQAFYDEYHTLSRLSHPCLPVYYGISESFCPPGQAREALTLCMEDRSVPGLSSPLTFEEINAVILTTGDILLYLLKNGVLYTDLHPSNLLLSRDFTPEGKTQMQVTLVDFTYCYYFLTNPAPSYSLRFSYDLSPNLKGQQLLIQSLTYLFYALLEEHHCTDLPSFVYSLLETGRHPSEELTLEDFLCMFR